MKITIFILNTGEYQMYALFKKNNLLQSCIIAIGLLWCAGELQATWNKLNCIEALAAFARGTCSKIECGLVHKNGEENIQSHKLLISLVRATHDVLVIINHYRDYKSYALYGWMAIDFAESMFLVLNSLGLGHQTYSSNSNEQILGVDEGWIPLLRGQILPEIERFSSLYIAYANDHRLEDQQLLFVAQAVLSLARTCQVYLDQQKPTKKNILGFVILVQALYAAYQFLYINSRFNTWLHEQHAERWRLEQEERAQERRRLEEEQRPQIEEQERRRNELLESPQRDAEARRQERLIQEQRRQEARIQLQIQLDNLGYFPALVRQLPPEIINMDQAVAWLDQNRERGELLRVQQTEEARRVVQEQERAQEEERLRVAQEEERRRQEAIENERQRQENIRQSYAQAHGYLENFRNNRNFRNQFNNEQQNAWTALVSGFSSDDGVMDDQNLINTAREIINIRDSGVTGQEAINRLLDVLGTFKK